MVRTAGRVADGVLRHGLFTDRWWTESVEPALSRRAADSGREPADYRRGGWLITAIDDEDPAWAIREAKLQIALYLTVRTYDSLVELHGWQAEVAAIPTAFRSDHPDSIADHVTDDMLWSIAICVNTGKTREIISTRTHLPDLALDLGPAYLSSDPAPTEIHPESGVREAISPLLPPR